MGSSVKVRLPSGIIVEVLVEDSTETVASFKTKLTEILGEGASFRLIVDGRALKDSEYVASSANDKTLYVSFVDQPPSPGIASGLGNLDVNEESPPNAAFSSAMSSMLGNNPELMKSIIMSHPQLKSMMEKSPQLREAMSNPQVLQDMVKLATNPQYYREAMLGADRAMSQLENIPQGFQMLRQLHEQIDTVSFDPLGPKPKSKLHGSSPTASLQSKPLPNPWASHHLPARSSSAPPEYPSQMSELKNLGFEDSGLNLEVLRRTKGNVQSAVEILTMDADSSNESEESEQEK